MPPGWQITLSDFRESILLDILQRTDYQVVVLDLAPSFDVLHVNGLVASDWVLIPTRLDALAVDGGVYNGRTILPIGLTKAGAGTLSLTGSNTLGGAVAVNAGILNANKVDALNGMTTLTVAAGAAFNFGSGAGTTLAPGAVHTVCGGETIHTWRVRLRTPLSGSNATTSAPPVAAAQSV